MAARSIPHARASGIGRCEPRADAHDAFVDERHFEIECEVHVHAMLLPATCFYNGHMPAIAPPAVRYIYRSPYGWVVRLPAWHLTPGREHRFPDAVHGGKDQAFRAAQQGRDRLLSLSPSPAVRVTSKSAANVTGLVGVSLSRETSNGASRWYWKAFWSEGDNIQHKVRFSVRQWGFEAALAMAVEVRQRATGLSFRREQLEQALALEEHVHRVDAAASRVDGERQAGSAAASNRHRPDLGQRP